MSVRFSEATKLAWGWVKSWEMFKDTSEVGDVHGHLRGGRRPPRRRLLRRRRKSTWRYLGEGGTLPLTLDGDGGGAAQQDLVYVLLAELGAFVILFHDGRVGPFAQEVLDLLFGELLDLAGGWRRGVSVGRGR